MGSGNYNLPVAMFCFEIGYCFQHVGTALLIYKLKKQNSMYGICIDTHICYLMALIARCAWQFDTQLMSMWFTVFEVFVALSTQAGLIYTCYQYKDVLYKDIQFFFLRWWSIGIVSLIMATLYHPGKKGEFFFTLQMFVSFTIFLEALSLAPQLVHLELSKDTEGLNSYYLICLGLARAARVFFWRAMGGKTSSFWYLMSADVLHTILLFVFFYLYRKARSNKSNNILGFDM